MKLLGNIGFGAGVKDDIGGVGVGLLLLKKLLANEGVGAGLVGAGNVLGGVYPGAYGGGPKVLGVGVGEGDGVGVGKRLFIPFEMLEITPLLKEGKSEDGEEPPLLE